MNTQNQTGFCKELIDMERFGSMALRETFRSVAEKLSHGEQMADLADTVIRMIDWHYSKKESELIGTYFFLYENLCDYAKEHLPQDDYHRFCERISKHCLLLYM